MRRSNILISAGAVLILSALVLTSHNFASDRKAGENASYTLEQLESQPVQDLYAGSSYIVPDYQLNPEMELPTVDIDDVEYIGKISIPSVNIELPVASEWTASNAKKAPCRYVGSAYTDNMVIAGHNYRTHFARLTSVQVGDRVTFTDNDGNEFRYKVTGIEIIDGYDVEGLAAGDWDLSLFTCVYSGTARNVVRCERENADENVTI